TTDNPYRRVRLMPRSRILRVVDPVDLEDLEATPPRRRADAERNIAAILDAALACFAENPQATMADVARPAGVGRVTLYAHVPSRCQRIAAVPARALAEAEAAREATPVGDLPASQAIAELVRSSWRVLDRHRALFEIAHASLGHQGLRRHHDPVMARFDRLIA